MYLCQHLLLTLLLSGQLQSEPALHPISDMYGTCGTHWQAHRDKLKAYLDSMAEGQCIAVRAASNKAQHDLMQALGPISDLSARAVLLQEAANRAAQAMHLPSLLSAFDEMSRSAVWEATLPAVQLPLVEPMVLSCPQCDSLESGLCSQAVHTKQEATDAETITRPGK